MNHYMFACVAPCEFWIESFCSSNAFPVMACSCQCHTRQCVNVVWIRPILSTGGVYVRSYTYLYWLKRLFLNTFFSDKRGHEIQVWRGYKNSLNFWIQRLQVWWCCGASLIAVPAPAHSSMKSWLQCAWAKTLGTILSGPDSLLLGNPEMAIFSSKPPKHDCHFNFLAYYFNINQLIVSCSCWLTLVALL